MVGVGGWGWGGVCSRDEQKKLVGVVGVVEGGWVGGGEGGGYSAGSGYEQRKLVGENRKYT